jgi:hypothetical protein
MDNSANSAVAVLRRYCICIIEFLSSQAIDPHLYFQQKMTGEAVQANSIDDQLDLLRRLISWSDTMFPLPTQSDRLNSMLADQGLPPLSMIRDADNESIVKILNESG